jgi:hypothetical protein
LNSSSAGSLKVSFEKQPHPLFLFGNCELNQRTFVDVVKNIVILSKTTNPLLHLLVNLKWTAVLKQLLEILFFTEYEYKRPLSR